MSKVTRDYGEENNLNLRIVIGFARNFLTVERSVQRVLSKYNLTLTQFSVLETLYHLGDMNISQMIEKTLTTAGNMTVVIKNLEKGGLIKRYKNPDDKRACHIGLTETGQELIGEVFPVHLEHLSHAFERLNTEEKKELISLFKKMSGRKTGKKERSDE